MTQEQLVAISAAIALVIAGVIVAVRLLHVDPPSQTASPDPPGRRNDGRPATGRVELDTFALPDQPSNAELAKIRVRGGARTWQFMAAGYTHDSQSGPVPRWQLYLKLADDDPLVFVRQPDHPFDSNAIMIVPETGEIAGVDVGMVPREDAAVIAPLLDGGALFFVKVQKIARENQYNGFPKLYIYARMVKGAAV